VAEKAFGDRRGALVAIEPATGGVLALVSMPTYDPNLFVDGIDPGLGRRSTTRPTIRCCNRAIYGAYPPGSTFKPFMALAGLETGKRTREAGHRRPATSISAATASCDDKIGGHGMVDLHKSIVVSCNTYYYQLANDLGIDGIAGFMAPFGFGERTGIDLPGEATGVLPSPEWKRKRFKKPEQQKWYRRRDDLGRHRPGLQRLHAAAAGQALAALANRGVMFRPHLVKYVSIRAPASGAGSSRSRCARPRPQARASRGDPRCHGRRQQGGHRRARLRRRPYTSRPARPAPPRCSRCKGPSTTTEKHGGERCATTPCSSPSRRPTIPKIALAVLVENGGFGAQAAAPIARQVLDYYLLGKKPKAPALPDEAAVEGDG
jgi:penicillin-binding protein 2